MSDDHYDHLDDELLSAALDGEATPAEQAHLRGCATCQAGVARFGQLQRWSAPPSRSRRRGSRRRRSPGTRRHERPVVSLDRSAPPAGGP